MSLDRSNKRLVTGQQIFVIENAYSSFKDRQLNTGAYESGFFESLENGLTEAEQETKAQPIITSSKLTPLYGLQSSGNLNLAQRKIGILNRNYLEKHVELINNNTEDVQSL